MNTVEIKLCGLCFTEICDNNYKITSKNDRFMLDMLLIKLNLDMEDTVICSDCDVNLKKCYDFKITSLPLENKTLPNAEHKTNCEENLEKQGKNCRLMGKQTQCCFCRKVIEQFLYDLSEIKENIFLIDLIQTHIPEMNLKVNENPMACEHCLEALKNFHNFVTNCLYVEKDLVTPIFEHVDMSQQDNKIWIKKLEESGSVKPECTEVKSEKNLEPDNSSGKIMDINVTNQGNLERFAKAKYKCKRCAFSTEHKNKLFTHILTHNKLSEASLSKKFEMCHQSRFKLRIYKCYNCKFESQYKRSLVRHMVQHKPHWRCWPNYNSVT